MRPGKFLVPASMTGQLERTALLARFEQSEGMQLILINACAGYGKTVVLQQYRERCLAEERRVLWCNLDDADNDLPRLVSILHSGLRDIGLINDTCQPAPAQMEQALLECIATSNVAFALLLDEFEAIHNPQVLEFFQQLLQTLPANGTLAIASRTTPPLNLGRLRARGQLLEIGTDALRLSLDEATQYITHCRQLALGSDDMAKLYERTEGWITGIFLATLSLQWHSDPATFIESFSGANPALAEYFAEDVFVRQPEPYCQFLLQTSVLPQFCPSLCDAVGARSDSKAMIEALERANLFIVATDEERQRFRYHPLFAEFLQHSLEQQQPNAAAQLNLNAAKWYFAADRSVDALEHLFAAHDLDEAATQLILHVDSLVESGHASLMMRWLSRIPNDIRETHPDLGIAYAWALLHARRYKEALLILESLAVTRQPSPIHSLLLLLNDRVEEALASSRELLQRLPHDTRPYRITAIVLICSLLYSGRYDEARHMLASDAVREAQADSPYLRDLSDSLEAILDITQGQLDSGLSRLMAASRRSREQLAGAPPEGFPLLQATLCLVMYETDALEQAQQRLIEMLPYARKHAASDSLITTHILLARIAYLNDDRPGWMRYLADLDQLGRVAGSTRTLCSTWLERARVATLENRFDTADHAMRSAEQLSDWERPGILLTANDVDTPFIARQRLCIAQGVGNPDELLRAMEEALQRHQHRRALKLRLLLALALDCAKRHKEALEHLTLALRVASHVGFIRTFLDEGAPLNALLERWSVTFHGQENALGIQARFVAHLLQRNRAHTEIEAKSEDASQVNLSARELQVLRLLALGYRNREIAEKMFLSELTVKSHLRKINTKLGAGGRTEAVSIARTRGLLD
ncbi:HTH-type transcriptional regulator MalT [Pseudomonas fluorescens]|uniref:HTH-type transcriptional regulator MalT n=1 Tax=Pseudomonas fluorescens TaxID=294 RepID=A0A5E6TZY7_PSEFL|nr:LuxR C-terminal-related transcriptional regulator [Pseudomonas fluorescens]VVM96523.1 HTH-type transcriptional regulator MalT [Pseudomonas fluorescens]VVP33324.1 HTH-type transcriptional regulator MalT [Pseudomonas fluorescens]